MNTRNTQKYAVMFLRARHLTSDGHDRAHEKGLIDAQREYCNVVADSLNVTVLREYVEYGGTGSIDKRPELKLMLDELRALRDVAYVITEKRDRMARRNEDWRTIDFELQASGTQLVTVGGVVCESTT